MIYHQPITFWAIYRNLSDPDRGEIAEHPDGALKFYAEKRRAKEALDKMPDDEDWTVEEILLVPPPMTESYRRERLKMEIADMQREAFSAAPSQGIPKRPTPSSQKKANKKGSL